jgi:vancomycin resistance protein YoaR
VALIGTARALSDAVRTDAVYVRLPVRRLAPPNATVRDLRHARFDQIVAAHETRYARYGESVGRARNIELAASFLDGVVIEPRGELSFNEEVGERTFERGFAPAIELARGGRRTEGIGGGICQVAATLHAAAFFAGFDIIEHHPHTRTSSYIPAGLDSAVSWPNADLRIRNPHDFHVRVRATAYRGVMRIELMGARRAPRVEWNTHIVHRIHRQTEREVDPNLPVGTEEVLDEGEDGSVMERTRTVYWPDGAVTQTDRLRYPVVHRLVRVGPQAVGEAGP